MTRSDMVQVFGHRLYVKYGYENLVKAFNAWDEARAELDATEAATEFISMGIPKSVVIKMAQAI